MRKGVRWRDVKSELLKDDEFRKEVEDSKSGYEIACKVMEEFIKEYGVEEENMSTVRGMRGLRSKLEYLD